MRTRDLTAAAFAVLALAFGALFATTQQPAYAQSGGSYGSRGGGFTGTLSSTLVISAATDITTPQGDDLLVRAGGTGGSTGMLNLQSQGNMVQALDSSGNVDLIIQTGQSGSGSTIVQWNDPGTGVTAATQCDAAAEVGKVVRYNDTGSNGDTLCLCEQVAGVIGWAALTPTGDCTP